METKLLIELGGLRCMLGEEEKRGCLNLEMEMIMLFVGFETECR